MDLVCLTVACVCELCCLGLFGLFVVGVYISGALLELLCFVGFAVWLWFGVVYCLCRLLDLRCLVFWPLTGLVWFW